MPGVRAEPGPCAASATSSRPPPTAARAAVSPRGSAGPHGDATRHELTVCRLCVTTTVTFALGLCASAGGSPGLVLTCAAPQLPSWTSPQAKAAGGEGGGGPCELRPSLPRGRARRTRGPARSGAEPASASSLRHPPPPGPQASGSAPRRPPVPVLAAGSAFEDSRARRMLTPSPGGGAE